MMSSSTSVASLRSMSLAAEHPTPPAPLRQFVQGSGLPTTCVRRNSAPHLLPRCRQAFRRKPEQPDLVRPDLARVGVLDQKPVIDKGLGYLQQTLPVL